MFDLMFTIVPVIVIGMFIYAIVSGIGSWHKNNNSCLLYTSDAADDTT